MGSCCWYYTYQIFTVIFGSILVAIMHLNIMRVGFSVLTYNPKFIREMPEIYVMLLRSVNYVQWIDVKEIVYLRSVVLGVPEDVR